MKCCNSHSCKNVANSNYMNWLLELIAPVIMGSKCSEIINIPYNDINKFNKINEINAFFTKCSVISVYTIDKDKNGIKLLLVNKKTLDNQLSNKKVQSFLKFLGYPKQYDIDVYIYILVNKISSCDFPHEIGIFLGYPLKDVVGFMGYGNYPFYKTNSWRIFGDPTPSLNMYNNFLNHREIMKNILSNHNINNIKDLLLII